MPANHRLVVMTTGGEDREDGNVYYSRFQLVTATGSLNFSEPEFATDAPEFDESGSAFLDRLRAYGYEVTQPNTVIVTLEEGNDLD